MQIDLLVAKQKTREPDRHSCIYTGGDKDQKSVVAPGDDPDMERSQDSTTVAILIKVVKYLQNDIPGSGSLDCIG